MLIDNNNNLMDINHQYFDYEDCLEASPTDIDD